MPIKSTALLISLFLNISPLAIASQSYIYEYKNEKTTLTESSTMIGVRLNNYARCGNPLQSLATELPYAKIIPVGTEYALVITKAPQELSQIQPKLNTFYFVSETYPIATYGAQKGIILNGEILVTIEEKNIEKAKTVLQSNKLKFVHQLRFQKDKYVFRAPETPGFAIFELAKKLKGNPAIKDATPNLLEFNIPGRPSLVNQSSTRC